MIPRATYRLQFREGMDFDGAATLVPYLARLGISHLYASPVFAAAPGSAHGYDVADHGRLDPDLGGEEGFASLSRTLHRHGMGLILDIVPNHMAVSTANPWWADVLAWGRESRFARHFDIDWDAPKLLLPVLGEPYGEALESGELRLALDAEAGQVRLRHHALSLPLAPASLSDLFSGTQELASLAARLGAARPADGLSFEDAIREAVADPATRAAAAAAVASVNGDCERLHAIHEAQAWRLAYWRLAREGLTYRRFFEIADLIGVRVEDAAVFADVHGLTARLVREGAADGLRIDHIDGLADPAGYLARLRAETGAPYVVVEKILGPGEDLRADWDCEGTTGYEVAAAITGLQIDSGGAAAMTESWLDFTGENPDFGSEVLAAKRRILTYNLASELEGLTLLAHAIAAADRATRDFGRDALRMTLIELAVALPVYRTYLDAGPAREADRALVLDAADAVRTGRESEDERVLNFVVGLLLDARTDDRAAPDFVRRFQQLTGPLTAKAVEDTVFYRFNRLIALNEVGAEPDVYGLPPADFHAMMTRRAEVRPLALTATATHDTKRGEDARARLAALSEMPRQWAVAVARWQEAAADLCTPGPDGPMPGPRAQWLLFQALAGAWPADLDPADAPAVDELAARLDDFMIKALREAKRRTSWTAQDTGFEVAVSAYVRGLVSPANAGLLADMAETLAPVIAAGAINSLAQLALKLTLPGVPDIYQGTELLDFSMVDPDNRRAVDFALRAGALERASAATRQEADTRWREGLPKMRLLLTLLDLRRRRADLFAHGAYRPLDVDGPSPERVVAFARELNGDCVVAAVPRLVLGALESPDPPRLSAAALDGLSLRMPRRRRWRFAGEPTTVADGDVLALGPLLAERMVLVLEPADA